MILVSRDYNTAVDIKMVKLVPDSHQGTVSIMAFAFDGDSGQIMATYSDRDRADSAYLGILEDWQRGVTFHDMQHYETWNMEVEK